MRFPYHFLAAGWFSFGATFVGAAALTLGTLQTARAQTYTLSTLGSFNTTNGANPNGNLVMDSMGNLYGTTSGGGASSLGTVFKVAAGTGTLSTVATFNGANGSSPFAGLAIDSGGNLYGTTYNGGANNLGTVFKITSGTGTISTIASFNGTNGQYLRGGVTLDGNGNIFGTTGFGGASSKGTVFEIAAGTSTITTITTFNGVGTNGALPFAGLTLDGSGNLYGTTYQGGSGGNNGTVFKIAAGATTATTLASFNYSNGANPFGGVILDKNGNLYGTAYQGGAFDSGTVFKIAAGTTTLTTLVNFSGTNGSLPRGDLTLDSSGNLYGTTVLGGTSNAGNVFKITSGTNALSTIATFFVTNGASPTGGLLLDSSGNFYGTAGSGASGNPGSVFKLTSVGAPEPGTLLLFIPGAIGLVGIRRFKHRARRQS